MKAAYFNQYGKIEEVIKIGDFPKPEVGRQDVLIEVHAAGVNPIDWKIAEGMAKGRFSLKLPAILGYDAAGVIIETGDAATHFRKGAPVYSRVDSMRAGTFAEFVAVDESLVALKPANIDFVAAASVPLAGLTAWQFLFEEIKLKKGQKILIHAGSGGVGSFAIQFAKQAGAQVATTVGPGGVDLAKKLGADQIINYRTERFEDIGHDFDAVLDTVGGETQERSLSVLKTGGVLASTLGLSITPEQAEKVNVRLHATRMHPDAGELAEVAKLIESGKLRPIIDRTFPLSEAKEALLYSRAGHAKGKIVITVK